MSLFSFLFGPKPVAKPLPRSGALLIAGTDDFDFEIVGESNYQQILQMACGGKCDGGHELRVAVSLEPEPSNPHDKNAVKVTLVGHTVGYLARNDAAEYLIELDKAGFAGLSADCYAHIVGGWKDERSEGSFGVRLDIEMPPDFKFVAD